MRSLILIALLLLPILSSAASTTVQDVKNDQNYTLWLKVTGEDSYSGTNCYINIHAYAELDTQYSGSAPWSFAHVKEISLTINGQQVDYQLPSHPPVTPSFQAKLRFASTHFAKGPLTIYGTAKIHLSTPLPIFPWMPPATTKDISLATPNISSEAYNIGLITTTTVNSDGQPPGSHNGEFFTQSKTYPQVAATSTSAASQLFSGTNHEVVTGTTHQKDVLVTNSTNHHKSATAFFIFSHGSNGSFEDLDGDNITSSQVSTAVNSRTKPLPNLVIIYACQINPSGGSWGPAYGVANTNGKALVGFAKVILSILEQGDDSSVLDAYKETSGITSHLLLDSTLADHSNRLLQRLAAGDTIGQALLNANEEYPPRGFDVNSYYETSNIEVFTMEHVPLQLNYQSDSLARLKNVYLDGVNESNVLKSSSWYKLIQGM